MRAPSRPSWLGLFAVICLLAAATLFAFEMVSYSRSLSTLPAGLSMGSLPVGGLTEAEAIEQVGTLYRTPLTLEYRDQVILLRPDDVGFTVQGAAMLSQANQFRQTADFWTGLWDYLWLRPGEVRDIPLQASYSRERLRSYLQDIAARYDRPGQAPQADAATLGFRPGEPGHQLDVEAAADEIDRLLRSPTDRTVRLPVIEQTGIRPSYETLQNLLIDYVRVSEFDGVVSLYLADLRTGQELNLTLSAGAPVSEAVAFSGMSTIKIPIMASFFAHNLGELSDDETLLLKRSIDESANTATDLILSTIGQGDGLAGTRVVVADMQRLGLSNTFISGLLDVLGAVLAPLQTPANARADITTLPDPYNQTTAEDMGGLLTMIHQCSQGGGALLAAFPGQVVPRECQVMIDFLTDNQVGPIFVRGGTEAGVVAHKHGWDRLPLNNVADAALVFTPGGNYALVIFIYRQETMTFDEANRLIIALAAAIYNFYNAPLAP